MAYYWSNRKYLLIVTLGLLFSFSCNNKKETTEKSESKKPELIMHKPSEMAMLMNALYAFNLQTKNQIIAGESPAQIPLDLLKLHSAEMTKGKERTKVWNSFVNVFIESQQAVADTLSSASLKSRYNTAINNCLACHKTECVGPIPKIKKLLIK
ncbi:hypothetical protein [Winogradskyella luteola]|uniref:Cytochrome c n=1 Tax=Winogradskyella luteola TaxID=2828330 RepID=A0A9X1F8N8_9FLAO|nr:hypothetical protein [Winogradskyella luteola]MBV7268473.1 hypothetical protein [Winogradskyella luteola]